MKHLILGALILISATCFSQKKGKNPVSLKAISEKYEGDTKKGLAHGQGKAVGAEDSYEGNFKKGLPYGEGTYVWGNGNEYVGEFSKGKMNGEGELRIKRTNNLDSILSGYFKNNEYIGKYKQPYKVLSEVGVRSVDFQEQGTNLNQVTFEVYLNGKMVEINQLEIRDDNNSIVANVNNYKALTNVVFPLKNVELSFTINGTTYKVVFNIFKECDWKVVISA